MKLKISYEKEVRFSLLSIIILAGVFNLFAIIDSVKYRSELRDNQFSIAATTAELAAGELKEGLPPSKRGTELKRLKTITGVDQLDFITAERISSDLLADDSFITEEQLGLLQSGLDQSVVAGNAGYYFRPVFDRSNRFLGVLRVKMELEDVGTMAWLTGLSGMTYLLGLLILITASLALSRTIMRPLKPANIGSYAPDFLQKFGVDPDKMDSAEIGRRITDTIAALEQREKTLREMYFDSEKRAAGLAKYNEYILGSITSGVIIVSASGNVNRFNAAAERTLRMKAESVNDRHYNEAFAKQPELRRLIFEALEEQREYSRTEIQTVKGSGERVTLGITSSVIRNDAGQPIGAAILLIDLSRIKRRQQQAALTEQLSALGKMSAGLAHELRNSLGVITGYARFLQKLLDEDDKTGQALESILSEADAMGEMMARFLNFARQEEPRLEPVDLHTLVAEVAEGVSSSCGTDEVDFKWKVSDKLNPVLVDRLMLRQAIQNLLRNSYEAVVSDAGEPGKRHKIRLRVYKVASEDLPPGEQFVKIVVVDNGPGIDGSQIPQLFHPFHTNKEKGTGLGLALVKKAAILHRGDVNVVSKLNRGTVFTMRIPYDPHDKRSRQPDEIAPAADAKQKVSTVT